MNHDELLQYAKDEFAKCLAIMEAKNQDYSGGGDAFKNLAAAEIYGVSPAQGIVRPHVRQALPRGNASKAGGQSLDGND